MTVMTHMRATWSLKLRPSHAARPPDSASAAQVPSRAARPHQAGNRR